jgi:streptogramin lyase
MTTVLRDGELAFEVVENWAKLPPELDDAEVAAVAVDESDTVFVMTRGAHPVVVLDSRGNVLRTVGHGIFKHPHGLHIGADGNLYCTDDGDHTVRRCTPEGRILLGIGVPGRPAGFMSGQPFHCCTHTALSPQGEIYVADGYGNACVHKYSPC